jgi:plastocyanin
MLQQSSGRLFWFAILIGCVSRMDAQMPFAPVRQTEAVARLAPVQRDAAHKSDKTSPAVIWLSPLHPSASQAITSGSFTLLQKNKMFTPHLLIVPVGSSVVFPNADPFFHNVFSLFDGRRFDLGLYEAGSTRSVVFSREGVSYIFCNIHSEMSAVVIALMTPYFGVADQQGVFHLKNVPYGDYDLHVWIEGQKQSFLDQLTRRIHVAEEATDLGEIRAGHPEQQQHLNKFGRPYEPDSHPIY